MAYDFRKLSQEDLQTAKIDENDNLVPTSVSRRGLMESQGKTYDDRLGDTAKLAGIGLTNAKKIMPAAVDAFTEGGSHMGKAYLDQLNKEAEDQRSQLSPAYQDYIKEGEAADTNWKKVKHAFGSPVKTLMGLSEYAPQIAAGAALTPVMGPAAMPAVFGASAAADNHASQVQLNPETSVPEYKEGVTRDNLLMGDLVSGGVSALATAAMPVASKRFSGSLAETLTPSAGIGAMSAGSQLGSNVSTDSPIMEGVVDAGMHGAITGGFFGVLHAGSVKAKESVSEIPKLLKTENIEPLNAEQLKSSPEELIKSYEERNKVQEDLENRDLVIQDEVKVSGKPVDNTELTDGNVVKPVEVAEPVKGPDATWSSSDGEIPVKFINHETELGPDGQKYSRVEMDGKESLIPTNELKIKDELKKVESENMGRVDSSSISGSVDNKSLSEEAIPKTKHYGKVSDDIRMLIDNGVAVVKDSVEDYHQEYNKGVDPKSKGYRDIEDIRNNNAGFYQGGRAVVRGDLSTKMVEEKIKHEITHKIQDSGLVNTKEYIQLEDHVTKPIKPIMDAIGRSLEATTEGKNRVGLEAANSRFKAGLISADDHKLMTMIFDTSAKSYGHEKAVSEWVARKVEKFDLSNPEMPKGLTTPERFQRNIFQKVYEKVKQIFSAEKKEPINDKTAQALFRHLLNEVVNKEISKRNLKELEKVSSPSKIVKPRQAVESLLSEDRVSPISGFKNSMFDKSRPVTDFIKEMVGQDMFKRMGTAKNVMPVKWTVEKFPELRKFFNEMQDQMHFKQAVEGSFSRDFSTLFTGNEVMDNLAAAARILGAKDSIVDRVGKGKVLNETEKKTLSKLINTFKDDSSKNNKYTKSEALKIDPRMTDKAWKAYESHLKLSENALDLTLASHLFRIANSMDKTTDPRSFMISDRKVDTVKLYDHTVQLFEKVKNDSIDVANNSHLSKLNELNEKIASENNPKKIAELKSKLIELDGKLKDKISEINKDYSDKVSGVDEYVKLTDEMKANGYTPLMRFGDNGVYYKITDPSTGEISYGRKHFEKSRDAVDFQRKLKPDQKFTKEELEKFNKFGSKISESGIIRMGREDFLPQFMSMSSFDKLMKNYDKSQDTYKMSPYTRMELERAALKMVSIGSEARIRKESIRLGIEGWSTDPMRVDAKWINGIAHELSSAMFSERVNHEISKIGDVENGDLKTFANDAYDHATNGKSGLLDESAKNVKSLMTAWFLSTPVSALLNLGSNITNTPPLLDVYIKDMGVTSKIMFDAHVEAAKATRMKDGSLDLSAIKDDRIRFLVEKSLKEGRLYPSESMSLMMASMNGNPLYQAVGKSMMWMFTRTENFNRLVAAIAAAKTFEYARIHNMEGLEKTFREKGFKFSDRAAEEFMNHIIDSSQVVMNKGNTAPIARSAVGSVVYQFKGYALNQVTLLKQLPLKQRMQFLGLMAITAGTANLPFEDDIIDIIETVAGWMGNPIQVKRAARIAAQNMIGDTITDIVSSGAVSKLTGSSVDKRIGMANVIPGTKTFDRYDPDAVKNSMKEFGGPIVGLGSTLIDGIKSLGEGNFNAAARQLSPGWVQSMTKAIQAARDGHFTDSQGRRSANASTMDIVKQFLGAKPEEAGNISDIRNEIRYSEMVSRAATAQFAHDQARALKDGDMDRFNSIAKDVIKFNDTVDPSMKISLKTLMNSRVNALKQLNQSIDKQVLSKVSKIHRADAMEQLQKVESDPNGESD